MNTSRCKCFTLSPPLLTIALLTLCGIGPLVQDAFSQNLLYWTDTNRGAIYRMDPVSGTSEALLSATMLFPEDIEIDHDAGKIYWVEGGSSYWNLGRNRIRRSNIDGSEIEDLVEVAGIFSLALDLNTEKIYWTGQKDNGGNLGIYRANLDGTVQELLIEDYWGATVALDSQAGLMYWVTPPSWSQNTGSIHRSNLDGTGKVTLIGQLYNPSDIALDLATGMMYWTDINSGLYTIYQANLDGTNRSSIVELARELSIEDFKLDTNEGKVYWTAHEVAAAVGYIQRANLDGSGLEDLVTDGLYEPAGLALTTDQMFWTDRILGRMQSADRNGANVEDVISSSIGDAQYLALDEDDGKMYWVESNLIRRADIEGTNVEILVAEGGMGLFARGLELDTKNGTMYWTAWDGWLPRSNRGPFRANLDGSNREILPWGAALGLAIDSENDEAYWCGGPEVGNVFRSDLSGSEVEYLFKGERVKDIVLDLSGGKYYYILGHNNGIHRANIDGTGSVEAVVAMRSVGSLALDLEAGKMYWVADSQTIYQANFDGSGIETIATFSDARIGDVAIAFGEDSTPQLTEIEDGIEVPDTHQLTAAYPNPFRVQAEFSLTVTRSQQVRLDLLDMLGRIVDVLYEGPLSAYEVRRFTIDGSDFPGGMYIYRATGEDFLETGKVVSTR